MFYNLLSYSSVLGHLGCHQCFKVTNNVANGKKRRQKARG
jgi:hypothetical protein